MRTDCAHKGRRDAECQLILMVDCGGSQALARIVAVARPHLSKKSFLGSWVGKKKSQSGGRESFSFFS